MLINLIKKVKINNKKMTVINIILFIILFIVEVIALTISIGTLIKGESYLTMFISIVGIFICFICPIILIQFIVPPLPTEKDVLNKKAIYQETIHIIDSDSIKTYEIIWKK